MVSRTDGRFPVILIKQGVVNPRAIVVHPMKRYVPHTSRFEHLSDLALHPKRTHTEEEQKHNSRRENDVICSWKMSISCPTCDTSIHVWMSWGCDVNRISSLKPMFHTCVVYGSRGLFKRYWMFDPLLAWGKGYDTSQSTNSKNQTKLNDGRWYYTYGKPSLLFSRLLLHSRCLFWSQASSKASNTNMLKRSYLDGTNQTVISNTIPSRISSIAIDFSQDR